MKYLIRDHKGTYGYIKSQFIFEIIKTILLFAMAFGIFLIGYLTLHTKKSLWSIFAVLAMLPACKSFVGVIMLGRFKSLSFEAYDLYKAAIGELPVLFENIITTSQKSYFLPVLVCQDNTIIAYCTGDAKAAATVDEHLTNVLNNAGHKSVTVKIFDKEDAFIKRAVQMNENLSATKSKSTEAIFNTIKAVSL